MTRKSMWVRLALLALIAIATPEGLARDPQAEEILRRAIDAAGGERTLGRLKSPMMWMVRGTFHGMGDGIPFVAQYAAKWPDWHREEIEDAFVITVSGKSAWVSSSAGARKLAGPLLEERLKHVRVAWAERLFPLASDDYELSTIDGLEINGRETVGIKASHKDGRDVKFYFDNKTYLLRKMETRVVSPRHGPDPVLSEAFYSDHKSFAGIKMPAKLKLNYDKKLFVEAETIDYKMGATLDPKHFEEPE